MEEKTYQLVSDGRRLDVQLSEEAGISRSRAAALMEEGYCLPEGGDKTAGRAGGRTDRPRAKGRRTAGRGHPAGNPL